MELQPAAVIFDLDGVILDSETKKNAAHQEVAKILGKALPADFYPRQIGKSREAVARAAIEFIDPSISVSIYNAIFDDIYTKQCVDSLKPTSGSVQLVSFLFGIRCKLAVVTSSPRNMALHELERLGILHHFRCVVAHEDSEKEKPSPTPYSNALLALSEDPDRVIAIEDTDSGVSSATRAGICTIAYRHQMTKCQQYSDAAAIIDSLDPQTVVPLLQKLVNSRRPHAGDWEK